MSDDAVLARLRRFELLRSCSFWLPVYFLLFESRLTAGSVLGLTSVYYLSGVLLEVPSGWASDRLGRRPTLVLAALFQLVGVLVVASASGFTGFAVGQAFLSASIAFVSGTDTSFLYEHLRATDRTDRTTVEEARLQRWSLWGLTVGAVVGGLLGAVDLRLPYLVAAATTAVALREALALVEPPRAVADPSTPEGADLRDAARDPVLLWSIGLALAAMVFNHVPFELLQPYMANLELHPSGAPIAAGLALGATMWIASTTSRIAPALGRRLGLAGGALAGLAVQGVVIGGLSIAVHPALALLFLLRSVPQSLIRPLQRALIHPRISSARRATWFSLQSLIARLGYSGLLALAARHVRGVEDLEAAPMLELFRLALLGMVPALLLLWLMRPREERSR